MARPRKLAEFAHVARLSPSLTAITHGPGHVMLVRGDRVFRLNDSEAHKLSSVIAAHDRARGRIGAVLPETPDGSTA